MRSPDSIISQNSIEEFTNSAHEILEDSPQMDESNTKVKLIQPFLERVLGWEIRNMDLEYSVQMGGQKYHVDYALTLDEHPDVFVEAKGCDSPLTESDIDQLQSYLKLQDVTWGLLTNGKEYQIYQQDFDNGQAEFHLLASASIDDLHQHHRSLSAISKSSIEEGESENVVRYIRELNRAEQTLVDSKSDIADAIADTVVNSTSDILYQDAQTEGKELVDRLLDNLRDEKSTTPTTKPGERVEKGPAKKELTALPQLDLETLDDDDASVAVYSSKESGIEFITAHEAWGFININSKPDYFLIYLSKPHQEIRFLGVVDDTVDADTFIEQRDIPADKHKYDESKKVVEFETAYELSDPIALGSENPHRMQGLLYTTLGKVNDAETTDDF